MKIELGEIPQNSELVITGGEHNGKIAHFAERQGGQYLVRFPGGLTPDALVEPSNIRMVRRAERQGLKTIKWTKPDGTVHAEIIHGEEERASFRSSIECAEDWIIDNPTATWRDLEWYGFEVDEMIDVFDCYREIRGAN